MSGDSDFELLLLLLKRRSHCLFLELKALAGLLLSRSLAESFGRVPPFPPQFPFWAPPKERSVSGNHRKVGNRKGNPVSPVWVCPNKLWSGEGSSSLGEGSSTLVPGCWGYHPGLSSIWDGKMFRLNNQSTLFIFHGR